MASALSVTGARPRPALLRWPSVWARHFAQRCFGAEAPANNGQLALLVLAAVAVGYAVAVADVNALFICVSLLASVFILLDFRVGVVLLAVILPISASYLLPRSIGGITGLNPLNLLLLATLGAWFLQQSASAGLGQLLPRRLRWSYAFPIIVAAALGAPHVGEIPGYFYAVNSLNFNNTGGYLRDMLLKPMFMIAFAVLVGAAVVRSRNSSGFLLPMLAAVWVMGLMTLAFVYLSGASFAELSSSRARGFFSPLGMHANDLGRCYAIAYALMLFTFAASSDHRLRLVLLASMGMIVLALLLTFSRGAFLGFVLVNILFLLSRRRVFPLLLASAAFAGLVFLLPGAVFDRLASGWDHGLNAVSAGRIDEIWIPLLPELMSSPIWGHGLGSILWSDAMRAGAMLQVTHPHNAYLQALLDMGVIGLVLLCSYFVHVWKGFRRLARDPDLSPAQRGFYEGAAAGLVAFLLVGMAGSSLMPVPEQCFLWLAIGMMYGDLALKKETERVARG